MTFSIRSHAFFHGPNIWDRSPVTCLVVDAGAARMPGWDAPDLSRWYDELAQLVYAGTALEALPVHEAADPGTTIARMALNLQRIAGVPVGFCFSRERPDDSGYDVVVEHRHPQVGLAAARLAVDWLVHHLEQSKQAFDLPEAFERFVVFVATNDHRDVGRSLARAAAQRGIPLTTVDPRGRIVELGNGRYRKHICGPLTALTSIVSVEIARDKHLTNHFLRAAGLPVPDGILVRSLDQALVAARTLGYPVTIKPIDLGNAVGVSVDLRNDEEVRASFTVAATAAATSSGKILVERFVQGNDYRALVVNGRVASVRQRLRPEITGDGVHTVQQLIDRENADPLRGTRTADFFKKIAVDDSVLRILERLGLSLDDVPVQGQRIVLNLNGNRREGAVHIDCTDDIHPENVALLRAASNVIGLDIAGIDFITPDIAKPMLGTGGAIIEINESPGFNLHLFSPDGPDRDPGPTIMEMLFPPGQPVRVPVVAIAACDDSASVGRLIADLLSATGRTTGLATRGGVTIGEMRLAHVEPRNPAGPRTLLNNPMVEMAVVEVDAESIVESGLGFDPCDVAVIQLLSGLKTPFGQPVETVLLRALDPAGVAVLDAGNPEIRALAADIDAAVIFVNLDTDNPEQSALLDEGARAVVVRNAPASATFSLVSRDVQQDLMAIDRPEAPEPGASSPITLETLQAVVAVAAALKIPAEQIQECLQPLACPAPPT